MIIIIGTTTGDPTKYNWFINALLQIYLRLPDIGTFLKDQILSGRLKFNSEEYTLLADIIKEAYLNCYKEYDEIPSIDTSPFREMLKLNYLVSFPATENGDALLFMIYLSYFLNDIEDADPKIKKVTSNMQIKFLATYHGEDSEMYWDKENFNLFRFSANKIIPLIEKSKFYRTAISFNWKFNSTTSIYF